MAKILMLSCPDEGNADSFHETWQGFLAESAGSLPGAVRIVHNRATPLELRPISDSGRVGWRGVTELWFDDWMDAGAAVTRLSGESVLTGIRIALVPVDDRLIFDVGERPLLVKTMVLWRRRHDLSRQVAQDYWAGPHARVGLQDLRLDRFLKRYFQNHVVDRAGFDPAPLDGIAEFWLSDPQAFAAMGSEGDTMRKVAEDETNFMDVDGSEMLILEEAEVYRHDRSAEPWTAVGSPKSALGTI